MMLFHELSILKEICRNKSFIKVLMSQKCLRKYAQKSAIYCCLKIEGAERKNTGNIRLLIENDITGKLHNRKKWQKTSVDIS